MLGIGCLVTEVRSKSWSQIAAAAAWLCYAADLIWIFLDTLDLQAQCFRYAYLRLYTMVFEGEEYNELCLHWIVQKTQG